MFYMKWSDCAPEYHTVVVDFLLYSDIEGRLCNVQVILSHRGLCVLVSLVC